MLAITRPLPWVSLFVIEQVSVLSISGPLGPMEEGPDQEMLPQSKGMPSMTLIRACEQGDSFSEAIDVLLESAESQEWDLDWQNNQGVSLLIGACRDGFVEVARLLLKHGASVDAKSKVSGDTAMMYAIGGGHLAVVELLEMQASRARSRPSRKNLYEALLPVSDDWISLGVLLDCDYPTLQDFEKRKQNDQTCLLEMVDLLLRKIDMSWELVVKAVKKLGHEYQAQVIMQQFVSS